MLCMSMILTVLPGMESYAAGEGETSAAASELQDENSQRLEETTAIDENGSIYEISGGEGTVGGDDTAESTDAENTETEEQTEAKDSGIALFSARSASAVSLQVVNFNTKGNAVTYYNGQEGYTNGAYGADAAYLGKDSSGNIRFMLAGETGTVKATDVELVNYSSVANNVSYYTVSGGKLIHKVSQNLTKAPSSSINNGPAPSYLSEGGKYYSYDGHYFYTDYSKMLSDYQNNSVGKSAVNAGNAFYNYFQFLDMNDSTGYSGAELENILQTAMKNAGKSSSSSKLTGTGTIFVKYQNTYSVNALLSLSIAINESAWGTSSISVNKNNIFGLNAVDSSPGQSANYFASVDDCIREFMSHWMANGYLKDGNWKNYGEYLGNKDGGINVKYASDPYWGEKAAALAWSLDTAGGNRDYLGTGSDDGASGDTPSTDEGVTPPTADKPTGSDEPTVDNEPAGSDEPTVDNEPAGSDEPTVDNEPAGSDEPTVDNEPAGSDEPTVDNEPAGSDEPTVDNESSGSSEPTVDNEPTGSSEPAVELKPSVQEQGSLNNPTVEVTPVKSSSRELTDSDRGITVSGQLSGDAVLSVKTVEPNTEEYTKYVSADPVKGKVILGVYDITLTGTAEGEIQLTFQVNSEFNGKNVIILHYLDDGSYETYKGTVKDGRVTISVKGFSPYVIALDEASSDSSTANRAPQTGDTSDFGIWIAMMGVSVSIGLAAVLKRRALR